MGRKRYSSVVNIIIIVFVIIFSVFIVLTISNRRATSGAAANPPQGGAGASQGGAGAAQGGAGAAQGGRSAPQGAGAAGQASRGTVTAVRVTPVILDTIENNLIINGDVLSSSQQSVFPSVNGTITELRVKVGDTVRRGQTVAVVDPSRPGDLYNTSSITSSASGTVLQVSVNPGDTVSTSTTIIVVGNTSDLFVETFLPERFSVIAKTDMPAVISFEAMPGEIFAATVTELSPVLDPATRTLRIRLKLTMHDSRVRPGMFATINLVIGSHENVPVVPRSAVINTYGNWIVYIVGANNTAERREIKTGFENDDFIEITSGLVPGERVVTAGQTFLTGGDMVRIVD